MTKERLGVFPALQEQVLRVKEREGEPYLTPREKEVLELLAQGPSYKKIAKELEISRYSVGSYVGRARKHLGLPPAGRGFAGGTQVFYQRHLETAQRAQKLKLIEADSTALEERAQIPFTDAQIFIIPELAKFKTRKEIARAYILWQRAEDGITTTEIDESLLKSTTGNIRTISWEIAKKLRELGDDVPPGRRGREDLNRRLAILRIIQEKYIKVLKISPQLVAMVEKGREVKPYLTPRGKEVLGLLAQGLSTKEIATQLSISPDAVGHHFANIRKNLGLPPVGRGVKGGPQAFYRRCLKRAQRAQEFGLIEVDCTALQERAEIPFTDKQIFIIRALAKPQSRKEIARAYILWQRAEDGITTTEIDEGVLKLTTINIKQYFFQQIANKLRKLGEDVPPGRNMGNKGEDLQLRLAILRAVQKYIKDLKISPQLVAMVENDVNFPQLKILTLMAGGKDTPFKLAWRLRVTEQTIKNNVKKLCLNPHFTEARECATFSERCHRLVKVATELGILPTNDVPRTDG